MTGVFRKHPVSSLAGFVFGIVIIVLSGSYIFGTWLVRNSTCPAYENDPCDAAPMLAISIWMLSIPVSIGLAAFVSFVIYYLYIRD